MLTFIQAMALYPDVQRKAQAELDTVVGPDSLPNFDDRSNLPYIEATVKELLRWQPVIPIGMRGDYRSSKELKVTLLAGIPHAVTEDDVYEGYFIPKGTVVFGNMWYVP